jgi:magnesium chelatase family protein
MSSKQIETHAAMDRSGEEFVATLTRNDLSPRAYYRLLKTARTIADMENSDAVTSGHLAEAWGYRIREE